MTFLTGNNSAQVQIVMLNPVDAGFEEGLDAKEALGPDWKKLVDGGISNCF